MNSLCYFLQEKEKLASLEEKYSELSEGQAFTDNPVAIKEVKEYSFTANTYTSKVHIWLSLKQ